MKKVPGMIAGFLFLTVVISAPIYAENSRCTPTGTWYGGSYNPENEGYKYHYTFVPAEPGSYFAMADGAYNPDTLGAAVATTWTGELVKRSGNTYEIRLIALTSTDPTDPPDVLPMVWAVKGNVRFEGCDKITIEYDWFAIYEWGKVPFVDMPAQWNLYAGEGPIVETIIRMPMGKTPPRPPRRPSS